MLLFDLICVRDINDPNGDVCCYTHSSSISHIEPEIRGLGDVVQHVVSDPRRLKCAAKPWAGFSPLASSHPLPTLRTTNPQSHGLEPGTTGDSTYYHSISHAAELVKTRRSFQEVA